MTGIVVWNQHGAEAGRRIAAAVPEARVIDVPLAPTAPLEPAEVLFAAGRYSVSEAPWGRGLRWVHAGSSGIDGFPVDLLTAETVTCSRGLRSPAIAEFVLAALLAAVKDMPGIWEESRTAADTSLGTLGGATLGLIGVGTIGREIARRAAAFGTRCIGVRRTATTGTVDGIRITTLAELLAESDHVVVAAPATPATSALLDDAAFARVRRGLHLVNVSRGAVLDNAALLRALDSGQVGRATLDVTEPEPLPPDHPLRRHPRVFLSPHVSYQDGAPGRVVDMFIDNLRRYVAGQPLDGVVDRDAGY